MDIGSSVGTSLILQRRQIVSLLLLHVATTESIVGLFNIILYIGLFNPKKSMVSTGFGKSRNSRGRSRMQQQIQYIKKIDCRCNYFRYRKSGRTAERGKSRSLFKRLWHAILKKFTLCIVFNLMDRLLKKA